MDDLEARVDALYAGAPGDFTAARDALARELRAAGEREQADRVRALRRPSKLAAELNRLVREDAGRADALIAAEEALAATQARVVAGEAGAGDLREAEAAEAAAVGAFPGGPALHAALRFAARSPARREELRAGRLSQDPVPDAGEDALFAFGAGAALPRPATPPADEVAARRARRQPEQPPPPDPEREARAAEALAAIESARAREREALDAAAAAADRVGAADEERARREAERDRLRDELAAAEEALAAAEEAAGQAREAAAAARAAADAAGRARREAEATARDLLGADP
jgi:hypothetical protein